jgi:cation transport ATPase
VTGAQKKEQQKQEQQKQEQQKQGQQKQGQQKQEQQQQKKKKKGQHKQEPVVDSALSVQAGAVWMGRWGWVSRTVCGMDAALRAYMDVLAAGPGNPPPPAHSQAPQPPALKL